jgi:hypothetical protein
MTRWLVIRYEEGRNQEAMVIEFVDEPLLADWIKNHGMNGDYIYEIQSKQELNVKYSQPRITRENMEI